MPSAQPKATLDERCTALDRKTKELHALLAAVDESPCTPCTISQTSNPTLVLTVERLKQRLRLVKNTIDAVDSESAGARRSFDMSISTQSLPDEFNVYRYHPFSVERDIEFYKRDAVKPSLTSGSSHSNREQRSIGDRTKVPVEELSDAKDSLPYRVPSGSPVRVSHETRARPIMASTEEDVSQKSPLQSQRKVESGDDGVDVSVPEYLEPKSPAVEKVSPSQYLLQPSYEEATVGRSPPMIASASHSPLVPAIKLPLSSPTMQGASKSSSLDTFEGSRLPENENTAGSTGLETQGSYAASMSPLRLPTPANVLLVPGDRVKESSPTSLVAHNDRTRSPAGFHQRAISGQSSSSILELYEADVLHSPSLSNYFNAAEEVDNELSMTYYFGNDKSVNLEHTRAECSIPPTGLIEAGTVLDGGFQLPHSVLPAACDQPAHEDSASDALAISELDTLYKNDAILNYLTRRLSLAREALTEWKDAQRTTL